MLRERLGPRGLEVIEIDGANHYVNEKIKAEIERLRGVAQQRDQTPAWAPTQQSGNGAAETWAYIERLLHDECGLRLDEGLTYQRANCINAIQNGLPDPALMAAAVEFLSKGEGLHKIRVNGKMMDRKGVAAALCASNSGNAQSQSGAVVEEAMWMLQDVPGNTLIERIARLTKWYQDLCASNPVPSRTPLDLSPAELNGLATEAFREAAQQQGWQPIETAPKDASNYLVYSIAGTGEAWFSTGDGRWYWASGDPVLGKLTHWMPLPAPPCASNPVSSTNRCTCAAEVNPDIPHARFCAMSSTHQSAPASVPDLQHRTGESALIPVCAGADTSTDRVWQGIDTAPQDGRIIEVRFLTDNPRRVRWSQSSRGTYWHLADSYGPAMINFDPTEWRPVSSYDRSE
jgi:hypothetical protein